MNTVRVRVTGGVEDGDGFFLADLSLFDGCPSSGEDGTEIPGTRVRFSDLEDDLGLFHDLILDFTDRGICHDGSACEVSQQNCADQSVCAENPLEIPPTVWIRMRFDTDDARIVFGSPPTTGFSSDGYDDPQAHCDAWFGGWPTFPHASLWVELTAPEQCATHFLAYLAADPREPTMFPWFPWLLPPKRLGDDIHLSVDNCELSAFEVGMNGIVGPFEMSIDLRWPSILDVIPETVQTFFGRGEGSMEVAHFTIPPEIELNIGRLDQPIYITWDPNQPNTRVLEVNVAQVGESGPELFAFDTDPKNPETWNTFFLAEAEPAVFYAAVYCRGEPPLGACCPSRSVVPGLDADCVDDVPITSCRGARWLEGSSCAENLFDPPSDIHACCLPAGPCDNIVREECLMTCDTLSPPIECQTDQDCPGERTCGTDADANRCTPVCAKWSTGKFCDDAEVDCPQPCGLDDLTSIYFAGSSGFGVPGSIDAGQPHEPKNVGQTYGWDHMIMQGACNAATLPWSVHDFHVTSTSGNIENRPESLLYSDIQALLWIVLADRILPGEWTCIELVDTESMWCAGYLPGDVNQDGLVTAGDIIALIDSINRVPGRLLPRNGTDINRSGDANGQDILRLIDLLNGAGEFDPWITRSLPPCPSEQ
ncbi:MAG: hypothetical protein IH897_09365 [Planctomycetes bacterium]|nr:hypothetical protein [Planctomycetota bacterium]